MWTRGQEFHNFFLPNIQKYLEEHFIYYYKKVKMQPFCVCISYKMHSPHSFHLIHLSHLLDSLIK